MDSESLRTASEYLNNLLLARGLLRNGEPVDFVRPSKESRAQIINLVHDLVLRNDRDKEAREATAFSYRQLRADEDQKTHEIERLQAKHEEAARATVQAQTAERVAKDGLKKLEKSMRALQEQSNKLKASLAQVKTQCTNDVRKRDLELARLKTHLQDQQRGSRSTMVAPSMTMTGDRSRPLAVRDIADPEYSLKQETNEFLTQLSSSLSDENDRLIAMVRNAAETLRNLLGLQTALKGAADSGIGEEDQDQMLHTMPADIDSLTAELHSTMTHLKALLTNPNFVSIEEVEIREEELARMRCDWEQMEQRWHNLLDMMDGWRRRMATGGNINVEDLRKGMGLVSPSRGETTLCITQPEECSLVDDSIDEVRSASSGTQAPSVRHTSRIPKAHSKETGRSSPKRKRDPLDPPDSFDLRPRGATRPTSQLDLDDEDSEELEVPQMSVEEKLSAAACEAAAVRDSMQAGRARSLGASLDGSADSDGADRDTLGKMPTPNKRTKIRGKPKRRKSTLSRDELAELLLTADAGQGAAGRNGEPRDG